MAQFFSVYKVFRPATTILADDWTQLQLALVASFNKIGQARSDGLLGVDSTFACADPTLDSHAVTRGYMDANIGVSTQAALNALSARIAVLEAGE